MMSTILLIFNWALIAVAFFSLVQAFRKLSKGTPKPIYTGMEAIITVLAFGFLITAWNTTIPVWFWWLMLAGASLLAGATVMAALKVREGGVDKHFMPQPPYSS